MADEIAQLQAELAAAAALDDKKMVRTKMVSKGMIFKTDSRESKRINDTIKGYIDDMDELRRIKVPFVDRIKKAQHIYKYIMANPNVFASHVRLRDNCIAKAQEFLNSDFEDYADQANFTEARSDLRSAMQAFIDWTADILPFNIYYTTNVSLT